jgi:HEAT repeat protein
MVRYTSLEALAEIGTDHALDLLTAALLDNDTSVRQRAISVISGGFYYGIPSKALGERQLEAVISAVQDEDEETGLTAANVLCCRDLKGFGRVEEAKIIAAEELVPKITDTDAGKRKIVARKLVILGGEEASDALLKAINENDLAVVAGGCSFYLQNLNKSWEPIIVSALEQYGDITMASACLNSGSNVLENAARNWAAEHNVQVLG